MNKLEIVYDENNTKLIINNKKLNGVTSFSISADVKTGMTATFTIPITSFSTGSKIPLDQKELEERIRDVLEIKAY